MTTKNDGPNPPASGSLPDRYMLTRAEIAQALGVSTRTITALVAKRDFPRPYRFGVTRFRRDEVLAWLEKHRD